MLQPRISIWTDGIGEGTAVSEGVAGVKVIVGEGVSLLVEVAVVVMAVPPGVSVKIMGVGLTMPGVRDGTGVHTGKGCGAYPNVSHAASEKTTTSKAKTFFITLIIPSVRW